MTRHASFQNAALRILVFLALLASGLSFRIPASGSPAASFAQGRLESLSAAEFSRLVKDLSEEEGSFPSDNFTSNETSYLHVVDKLRQMNLSGNAYLGVGPEQNFTYIAKIRPRIAFIVDIRRQAMIQHLMYKALFHMSENRAKFLAGLLSRPLTGESAPGSRATVDGLLDYFSRTPASEEVYAANLDKIRKMIREDFRIPLSERDDERLAYVLSTFRAEGLGISTRFRATSWNAGGWRFPTLKDLIDEKDLNEKLGNFLAMEEDYGFVRSLQRQNRIIPVVGDFSGAKALAVVGRYLARNGYAVTVFYTSNVEQYLFRNGSFGAFVENVRKLPINERSVFIRAVAMRGSSHPANVPGHRTATLLQKIAVFLRDYDQGSFGSYQGLVTTHYLAGGDKP